MVALVVEIGGLAMNIGIVTTWFERGAAYVSRQYAQALKSVGHNIFIFARGECYARNDPIWNGQGVHWGRRSLWMDRTGIDFADFRRWLRRRRIDLVLFNEQRSWEPIAICHELGVKTTAYIDYYREVDVKNFAMYDGLICNTLRHFSVFDWHPGAVYISWGTDTDLFCPQEGSLNRLCRPNEVTFFHSAGISDRKGTDILIRAFAILEGDAHLVIHTQKPLHVLFPDLQDVAKKLTDQRRLTVVTKTVPAPGLYHLGDVYAYPTRLEGIGLTICEAMACGLPVIVPDNAPMNEFVTTSNVGRLVPVDRFVARSDGYYWPQGLVSELSLAIELQHCVNNPEWVLRAKAAARSHAMDARNWASNAAVLSDYFRNLDRRGVAIPKCVRPRKQMARDIASNLKKLLNTCSDRQLTTS